MSDPSLLVGAKFRGGTAISRLVHTHTHILVGVQAFDAKENEERKAKGG